MILGVVLTRQMVALSRVRICSPHSAARPFATTLNVWPPFFRLAVWLVVKLRRMYQLQQPRLCPQTLKLRLPMLAPSRETVEV